MNSESGTLLVTGSSGLIGAAVVEHLARSFKAVVGVDNNMREEFFGAEGSTHSTREWLTNNIQNYRHYEIDIRDRQSIKDLVSEWQPTAIVHTAAQPSHDRAAAIPFLDFEVNAVGTLNLLEATRHCCPETPFIHMSTNKVYGEHPNELPLIELASRWEYANNLRGKGIPESMSVDQTRHSLFGASKVSADILVQEYGRYFGIPTVCLRGGCLTGSLHRGVELHGFLNYLVKANMHSKVYRIIGHKGKQVRDNIHSSDVALFISEFIKAPRVAEVYNIGGGYANSVSILEAIDRIESLSGLRMRTDVVEVPRVGDHIVYYSDLEKMKSHYPEWSIRYSLDDIFEDLYRGEMTTG